jgi:NAD(P)H-dependent FMN reductase
MNAVKVVAIDGARRADSSSRKLLHLSKAYFEKAGAHFEVFDQSREHLPLFDDTDAGAAHESVVKLTELVMAADAVVFSSPEYHGSMSGAIKNAFDWLTLLSDKGRLRGKAIGLMGGGGALANSGATLQMMMAVRALHGILMPEVIMSVPAVWDAFDELGEIKEQNVQQRMAEFADKLVKYAALLKANRTIFQ